MMSRLYSSTRRFSGLAMPALRPHRWLCSPGFAPLLLVLTCLPSFTARAQDNQELLTLVFDPVPITLELDAGSPSTTVSRELVTLPDHDEKLTVSEFLASTLEYPEDTLEPAINATIEEYKKRITELELQGGAYAQQLSQEYSTLGALYESLRDYDSALDYLEKAMHNNRVNLGLYNLEQENIIKEKIKNHVAKGDLHAADLEQEYLFFIRQRAYGNTSVDLLPALTEYAEWSIFAFDSNLILSPTFPYAAQSRAFTENGVSNSIGEEDFKTSRLVHAQNIYRTIIEILLNNYGITDKRLLDMEQNLALTNYFFATNLGISSSSFANESNSALSMSSSQSYFDMSRVSTNSMGYRHGREALERRLKYMLNMEDISPEDIAKARLELGDWLMIFKKRVAAMAQYEEAYREFAAAEAEVPAQALDALFNPLMPVTIPTFVDYRFTRAALGIPQDQPLAYRGWFDVKVDITRYGKTRDVEILARSDEASDAIENTLLRQLRNSTSFRPRMPNGTAMENDQLLARYYYSY